MNLQQLHHLVALAETKSFSRASEISHVTQSALSRSIQTLEQELGLPLIDRIGKQNELTPFGAVVLEQAKDIVTRSEELKRAATLMADGTVGSVSLGIGSAPSALFAERLLSHVLQDHPKVQLRLLGGTVDAQLAQVRARELDAALLTYSAIPPVDEFLIEPLPALRSGFLCRAQHPLMKRRKVSFEDVRAYPLVSTRVSDETTRVLIERHGEHANPQRWIQASSEDVSALLRSVMSTDAVFLGVVAVARHGMRDGRLREIASLADPKLHAKFAFVSLRGRARSPVLTMIQEVCRALVDEEHAADGLS